MVDKRFHSQIATRSLEKIAVMLGLIVAAGTVMERSIVQSGPVLYDELPSARFFKSCFRIGYLLPLVWGVGAP